MASRILDAGALPHAVLDSCHKPTQRRGGLNGPSGKVSRRGCAGAAREGRAAVMAVSGVGGLAGQHGVVHGWIYRRMVGRSRGWSGMGRNGTACVNYFGKYIGKRTGSPGWTERSRVDQKTGVRW